MKTLQMRLPAAAHLSAIAILTALLFACGRAGTLPVVSGEAASDSETPAPAVVSGWYVVANMGVGGYTEERSKSHAARARAAGYEEARAVFYTASGECYETAPDQEGNVIHSCGTSGGPSWRVLLEGPLEGDPLIPPGTYRAERPTESQRQAQWEWYERARSRAEAQAQQRGIGPVFLQTINGAAALPDDPNQ